MASSQEYKKRHPGWNYGGSNWKLSRSKIEMFLECPRCFYLDNKSGIRRPSMPPFNINNAVDTLLKKEFDTYRAAQKPHPIMVEHGVDAVPFAHKELATWRENFEGVQIVHKPTGLVVSGAVDDLWVNPAGDLIIVDYKATSKEEGINMDDAWKDGYKRQMEIYQWLLRQKGFKVADTGYFVYANALVNRDEFAGRLDFELTLHPYTGNPDWVEETIVSIKKLLDSDKVPARSKTCEHCAYCMTRVLETRKD